MNFLALFLGFFSNIVLIVTQIDTNFVPLCFKLTGSPSIKIPIYAKRPLHNQIQKLDLKLSISERSKNGDYKLADIKLKIELDVGPCFSSPLEIPRIASSKNEKTMTLKLAWPETQETMEKFVAVLPHDFDEKVIEMQGLNRLFIMPTYFYRRNKISPFLTMDSKTPKVRSKRISRSINDIEKPKKIIEYEFKIYVPQESEPVVLKYSLESNEKIKPGKHLIVVEAYSDEDLKHKTSTRSAICQINTKKIELLKSYPERKEIYTHRATEVLVIKFVDQDGLVVNEMKYFKNQDHFFLKSDAKFKWDIFNLYRIEIAQAMRAQCGYFCLYPHNKNKRKCHLGLKEITKTESISDNFVIKKSYHTVSVLESKHDIRDWKPARKEEIEECGNF